jgi:hypothetical protein
VPRSEPDLPEVAARFDALYTELTGLQRELIAACRNGVDIAAARGLAARAGAVIAGVNAAERAISVGAPSARDVEAAALRARVMEAPLDPHLLFAVIQAQTKLHGYPLLADVLERARGEDAVPEAFGDHTSEELFAAPRGVGSYVARQLAEHYEVAPGQAVSDLDGAALERLLVGLREAAYSVPDGINDGRRRKPTGPADGAGAGGLVLDAWIDELAPASETPREEAVAAAQREGWPVDAVPVAERLVQFTEEVLAPHLVPTWDRIAAFEDVEQRLAAMRAEHAAWRSDASDEDQEALVAWWTLQELPEAMKQVRKARRLVEGPDDRWGSSTPLALSRSAARRCGRLLTPFEREVGAEFVAQLP